MLEQPAVKEEKMDQKESVESDDKKKLRYKCNDCAHTFQIKEGFNKQCPYCGKHNLTSQEWNSDLDALIEDSGKAIYDN